jgi:gamma-glutamylaminecyclotransferase
MGDDVLLFVYGTLLPGEANHVQLAGCVRLGDAATEPRYRLLDLGAWPALLTGGETSVRGELYAVPRARMPALDAFEGHPILFRRAQIGLAGGEVVEGYVFARPAPDGAPEIRSGRWADRDR